MAKLNAKLSNQRGKVLSMVSDQYIDIDLYHGNKRIHALTFRMTDEGARVFDENDVALPVYCEHILKNGAYFTGKCPICETGNTQQGNE